MYLKIQPTGFFDGLIGCKAQGRSKYYAQIFILTNLKNEVILTEMENTYYRRSRLMAGRDGQRIKVFVLDMFNLI